ncbi:iron complex transport system permease protein [Thermoactinomyces sp. DSM 45891]|uniref:FecCD family ABC transporter permease n=1 Tax=Thermoactinomyces sp. DSM 45891 TaxID=1761907 RepID=UPI00091CE039|nr:iron ABC transporter permease [Thermoactinomyces sp. DSM 45891]SFX01725.1 iron complex transport system permease protein [Thermoactinomyces sp. DSM 45891]
MLSKPTGSRYIKSLLILITLFITLFYISLTNGTFDLTVNDVLSTLLRINPDSDHDFVLFDLRLPRIIVASLVGLGLGVAGAIIQGITKNGLADPGILGINAGAGAAIVLFLFFFHEYLASSSVLMQPLFGLIGGLGASMIIYLLAWKNGRIDTQRLILTGIAISSGFGALAMYLSLKMKSTDFEMATVWTMGSVYNANWQSILAMLPWFLLIIPIYRKSYLLDLFQLEESSLKSLGVPFEKEKVILLLSSIGLVSACVSVSGGIGFIGLMAPHIAKQLVGLRHRNILPICGLIGMTLVVGSDFVAKNLFPAEISVGIVISIIGVPYFLYLLLKTRS